MPKTTGRRTDIQRRITSCKLLSFPYSPFTLITSRAISRTLNTRYLATTYGLGNVNTSYPISAFITDLVYLEGSTVPVDVSRITVGI